MANSKERHKQKRALLRLLKEAGLQLQPATPPPTKQERKTHPFALLARIPKWLYAMATAFGIMVALLTLLPRLSAANSSSIDLNDPFSAPIRVTNEGAIPLGSARFFMRDIRMKGENGRTLRITGEGYAEDWRRATFWPTDAIDLYPARVISSTALTSVELDVVVSYRPLWILPTSERVFHFSTQVGPDNKLHWMRQK